MSAGPEVQARLVGHHPPSVSLSDVTSNLRTYDCYSYLVSVWKVLKSHGKSTLGGGWGDFVRVCRGLNVGSTYILAYF